MGEWRHLTWFIVFCATCASWALNHNNCARNFMRKICASYFLLSMRNICAKFAQGFLPNAQYIRKICARLTYFPNAQIYAQDLSKIVLFPQCAIHAQDLRKIVLISQCAIYAQDSFQIDLTYHCSDISFRSIYSKNPHIRTLP